MTVEGPGDPSLCRRSALRHFRIVSFVYLLALITGTHWPRLELSGPSGDFDKLIHFFAFGLMIFCFWICNWITGFISLLVVGVGICFLIEITQATLSVGRAYSVHDIEAGAFGVLGSTVMIAALRPLPDAQALRIRALWARIAFSLTSRSSACLVILTSGSLGVLLGGLLAITIDFMILRSRGIEGSNAMAALMLGGMIFGIPAMLLSFRSGFRFETKRLGRVEDLACLQGWFRGTLVSCLVPALLSLAAMLICLVLFHAFLWDRVASLPFFKSLVFEDQGTILCLIGAFSIALYLRLLMKNLARRV
ncbi:MAG TPA: hypothetical protein DCX60_08750 [Phycisphaerales bacterium]|nr:hypothetical protein [Phycisphaerales bacterium]